LGPDEVNLRGASDMDEVTGQEHMGRGIVRVSRDHPHLVTWVMVVVTIGLAGLAAVPSLWPERFPYLNAVKVDTDPENMLRESEPVREFHKEMKEKLGIHDMVVVGVVNEENAEGVFNPVSLSRIKALTDYALTLTWEGKNEEEKKEAKEEVAKPKAEVEPSGGEDEIPGGNEKKKSWIGVIARDVIAPSTVDNIEPGSQAGEVKFEWLMSKVPTDEAVAEAVRTKAKRIPFLNGTLVSEDGKAVCVYLPLTSKTLSYRVYSSLRDRAGVLWVWGPMTLAIQEGIATGKDAEGWRAYEAAGRKIAYEAKDVGEFREKIGALGYGPKSEEGSAAWDGVKQALEGAGEYPGADQLYITGLPVAEDTFGVEMFKQMAISAPLAMLVIFLLMLAFFRKLSLIVSPMIVALVSVIWTMGLLIATGRTIHIMSSMIPIFIMPIAVLDSVHILSDFFDRYQRTRDRRKTVSAVMETLFVPMLYTSLTTAAGFASLALTPIPPVQVFGLYVAFGVMVAWVLTVTFIPAFVMLIPGARLEKFGRQVTHHTDEGGARKGWLQWVGRLTYSGAIVIVLVAGLSAVAAGIGIFRITINDNPTKWFEKGHPIRVADEVLNRHFGGTYMAYLTLQAKVPTEVTGEYVAELVERMETRGQEVSGEVPEATGVFSELVGLVRKAGEEPGRYTNRDALLAELAGVAEKKKDEAKKAENWKAWEEASVFVDGERQRKEVFKDPAALAVVEELQRELGGMEVVGKSNSVADIVRTVHRELYEGDEEHFSIPGTRNAVGQCLLTFQNSHRPYDLWHFVTEDYQTANLWCQLKSGDNRDMSQVVQKMEEHWKGVETPVPMEAKWFGLTYINVIWQQKMVVGMLQAFLGSFLVVLLMMIILFRSAVWGLLSMIPLTLTVAIIYGAIGFAGKEYDMPVAVLSSLTLGLAVDYAIHFLERSRQAWVKTGSWKEAVPTMFSEPARAISRNIIVIGVGFLPLLAAPLVPYKTVGVFMAMILVLAGAVSLLLLPALMRLTEKLLFPVSRGLRLTCQCGTCIVSGVTAVLLVAVNLHQFFEMGWNRLGWLSAAAVAALALTCALTSRRGACKTTTEKEG